MKKMRVGVLSGFAVGWRCLRLWMALIWVLIWAHPAHAQSEADFLPPEQAFVLSVAVVGSGAAAVADAAGTTGTAHVDVHFAIAPDYYLYRTRFAFDADLPDGLAAVLGEPHYPAGELVDDPTFGEVMEIYRHAVTVRLALVAPSQVNLPPGGAVRLNITSQGCAQAGLCYPPMRQQVALTATAQGWAVQGGYARAQVPSPQDVALMSVASGSGPSAASAPSLGQIAQMNDEGLLAWLHQASRWQMVGFSFLLGVLLSLTPCVLPMVPILLTLIAGQSAKQTSPGQPLGISRWRGLGLALAYVLGVSIVYTLLGVAAALLGASLNQWLQTPWVLGLFAVLLALLGASMLGAYTLQTPGRWQNWLNQCTSRLPGGHHSTVLLMGMLSAATVGACVVAPLAGLLLFISQTGQVALGAAALFALAWGAGVPLLLVGAGAGALLPRTGGWMNQVNTVFGVLLLATAWWLVSPFMVAAWAVLGWALLAGWSAVLLGAFRPWTAQIAPLSALGRAAGLGLAFWAALMLVSVALGHPGVLQPLKGLGASALSGANPTVASVSPAPAFERIRSLAQLEQRLAQSVQNMRPVMLDFYADWCVSCKQMERFTFGERTVAQRMVQFELLQVDVTAHNEDDRALLQRFNLYGPPGILFFDVQGQYLAAHRVIGFKSAGQFREILDGVLTQTRTQSQVPPQTQGQTPPTSSPRLQLTARNWR